VRRFDDFQTRLGLSRAILSDRLDKLVANFILAKVPYQEHPVRYEYRLTPKGLDLYPVILSMVHWGDEHLAGKAGRPILHRHITCQHNFDPRLVCSECGEGLSPREVQVMPGPGATSPRHLPLGLDAPPPRRRKTGVAARVDEDII